MMWVDETGTEHADPAVFFKVKEMWGQFSNMAGGYPLQVGEVMALSSEALYQALRFPHEPEWQREILAEKSPMGAKMASKKGGRRELHSRPDWATVAVPIMRWCVRVKFLQHWFRLGPVLAATRDRAIVERSSKDPTWGTLLNAEGTVLTGRNALGKLLMELREDARAGAFPCDLLPPVPGCLLLGSPIPAVSGTPRP